MAKNRVQAPVDTADVKAAIDRTDQQTHPVRCLEDMLIPHDSHVIETFYYDQGDLRMLVTAVRGEMQRRLNVLGAHVERVHGLLMTRPARETVQ